MQNFTAQLVTDYSYISEPPIFADIGEATLTISNTTMSVLAASSFTSNETGDFFDVELNDLVLDSVAEPFAHFDGISDFSEIATNIVNTLAAVIRNRLESFINGDYPAIDSKLTKILNKILGLV